MKAVEKFRGYVFRDDNDDAKPVVKVILRGAPLADAGLKELAALKVLQTLNLFNWRG